MILIENQKKEAQLWYEEANAHHKAENYQRALTAYNRVSKWNFVYKSYLFAKD